MCGVCSGHGRCYSCCRGGRQQSSLSRHATFSSSQTDVQVRYAYARRHKYATRAWNAQVHKTPSLGARFPRDRDVRHRWIEMFAGRARFPSLPNFLSSLPLVCFFLFLHPLAPIRLQQRQAARAPPVIPHRRAINLFLPLLHAKQSPLPVCASQPHSCASSLVASRSRRPRKARRTTATTGTGGDGATVSGPLARRNVPTVSITASLGSGTCG